MIKWFILYYSFLFFLFLTGVIWAVFSVMKRHDPPALIKTVLIVVFFIHVLIYALAGTMGLPFGWHRNFFYLLPVYFLVIFYFLRRWAIRRFIYYIFSSALLVFSLGFSIERCYQWQSTDLLREMVRLARQIGKDAVIIYPYSLDRWPMMYYAKVYGIDQRVLFLNVHDTDKYFLKVVRKLSGKDQFVVIQPFKGDYLMVKDRDKDLRAYRILEKKDNFIDPYPYHFLQNVIVRRPQPIFEYFYTLPPDQSGRGNRPKKYL